MKLFEGMTQAEIDAYNAPVIREALAKRRKQIKKEISGDQNAVHDYSPSDSPRTI